MEISKYLRQHARTIAGKSQFFVNSFAKALEVIPRQLCDNAGFDATDVLNKLRQKHASGEGANYGVDINTGGITDSFANFVWEPAVVKINAINAATEASCLILSVDETVKNPKVRELEICTVHYNKNGAPTTFLLFLEWSSDFHFLVPMHFSSYRYIGKPSHICNKFDPIYCKQSQTCNKFPIYLCWKGLNQYK